MLIGLYAVFAVLALALFFTQEEDGGPLMWVVIGLCAAILLVSD